MQCNAINVNTITLRNEKNKFNKLLQFQKFLKKYILILKIIKKN